MQWLITLITSKGNGYNYYGHTTSGVVEIVKERGCFYLAKYVIGEWLQPVWKPLRNFTLIE